RFHPEGFERAVRRLIGGNAGGNRPAVARDAVDGDGHLLVVLVDGDGDFGLGARGEQQSGKCDEKGTHVLLASRLVRRGSLRPPANTMPGIRLWFQWARRATLMNGADFFARVVHLRSVVIPGRAKREPGIHDHYREYGFRACAPRGGASRN